MSDKKIDNINSEVSTQNIVLEQQKKVTNQEDDVVLVMLTALRQRMKLAGEMLINNNNQLQKTLDLAKNLTTQLSQLSNMDSIVAELNALAQQYNKSDLTTEEAGAYDTAVQGEEVKVSINNINCQPVMQQLADVQQEQTLLNNNQGSKAESAQLVADTFKAELTMQRGAGSSITG